MAVNWIRYEVCRSFQTYVRLADSRRTGVSKHKQSSRGFSTAKPAAAAAKQQSTKSPVDHAAKEEQAIVLINQGKLQEAEAVYKDLIATGTLNYVVYANLAAIYGIQKRFDETIDIARKALELNPNQPQSHYNLANAYQEKGEPEVAIKSYLKALEMKPNYLEAHTNLGNTLKEQGKLDEAIRSYENALAIKPDTPDIHINIGNVYKMKNNLDDAINAYNSALRLDPKHHEAHWNIALIMLLRGNYDDGLEKYELRTKIKVKTSKLHAQPKCSLWTGHQSFKTNRQLLLVTEQGLGDTLQFMRFAIALRAQGMTVSLCAQPKLHNLIRTSGIADSILSPEQANRVTEGEWTPLLSTLRTLKVRPNNPIITTPYIKTTEEHLKKWADILSVEKRPIIGINWQGNSDIEKTGLQGRSLLLDKFSPIACDVDASLLALQKGFGSEQLQTCTFKNRFVSCQEQVTEAWDFLDTAAIIANCDLVITSDTAVAHLAGGMGKTTWLLLHKVPDWRWGLEGNTTFWYPSMRLFRQRERGDWDEVLQRVNEALKKYLGRDAKATQVATLPTEQTTKMYPNQSILAPISLGELIDKITILQIKTIHLKGQSLKNVEDELKELKVTLEKLSVTVDQQIIDKLKNINQELWNIEDAVRDCERRKDFGEDFIKLARSVYQKNDIRASIKKEINVTFGSPFTEEKSYQNY